MDLVVGATGLLGSEICRRLLLRNRQVRALVRRTSDPARVEQLRGLGAEIVMGDLRDAGSIATACRGMQTVVTTATSILRQEPLHEVDEAGQLTLVEAAHAAHVERVVYISVRNFLGDAIPLGHAKLAVERRLRDGTSAYTILRPTYFMDVWLSPIVGFDVANARAVIYGNGQNLITWIALGDVAEYAARCVAGPQPFNQTFELGGPEDISPLEVVQMFETARGRRFEVAHVSEPALRAQFDEAADPKQQTFIALQLAYAKGDVVDTAAVRMAMPFPLTSLRDYVSQAVPAAISV